MFSEDSKAESKRVTVLLVDEMDLLITKKQQVGFFPAKASDFSITRTWLGETDDGRAVSIGPL